MHKKLFSIGIEEEFQIIDPVTGDLHSHIMQIFEESKRIHPEHIKAEMHQSVVEMGTDVCNDIKEARSQVINLRSYLAELAMKSSLCIAAAGTHPFAHWKDQVITPGPRYKVIVEEMQDVARANLIFGLHVHIGIDDKDAAVHIMNAARYFLPHIFALSTNSPFWIGRNTGFKSFRCKVFDNFPRTGIPDYFPNWIELESYINLLIKTGCIDNAKKIYWDIRVHPFYDTLEFRICDIPMRVDETIAIAALFQALVAKLYKLLKQNLGFRLYRRALIAENKWRASRYGLDARLIDFGKKEEVDVRKLILEVLDFVDDESDQLDSRNEIQYVRKILEDGTGADRQLAVWNKDHDLKKVVDYIIKETYIGLDVKPLC
jgi:carboxylate-amine ligase